jgi:hypothetical protein
MQSRLERLLHLRGYWRRSPAWITEEQPPRGWQIHLHKPVGNPLLLDVLLLGSDGRYTEFELKRPNGDWSSEEQRVLCECHGVPVFRSVEDAFAHVLEWEENDKHEGRL